MMGVNGRNIFERQERKKERNIEKVPGKIVDIKLWMKRDMNKQTDSE